MQQLTTIFDPLSHFATSCLLSVCAIFCIASEAGAADSETGPDTVGARGAAATVKIENGIDAPAPQGQSVQWGAEPIEKQSPFRDVICLNDLWRFMPAMGSAANAPLKTGWGWLRVPGSWRKGPLPEPVRGTGPAWEGFGNESPAAWYQRSITIPSAWQGRAIILDISRVSTDAIVFIDGQKVGEVSWPGGEVDLSAAVRPGQSHTLLVKVIAVADKAEVTRFMGTGEAQVFKEKLTLSTRGIIGDVLLTSRPSGAHLTGCAIRTSVKPASVDGGTQAQVEGDTLTVEAEYTGLSAAAEVTLTAIVRNKGTGEEVGRFVANGPAEAGNKSVTASWQWKDPVLWDIHNPHLYTMELGMKGPGIDDAILETFGFREFRIEGKRFLLNGTEIRLRPGLIPDNTAMGVRELIASALDGLRWAGFNSGELWPWDRDERGTYEFDELWCREADQRGFLLIVPALSQGQLLGEWTKSGVADAWGTRMAPMLKRLRNHPSAVMWVTGANRFGHGQDQNPVAIGSRSRAWLKNERWQTTASHGLDTMARIKAVDPTRPVFMHAGGAVGDVYTSNNYLCIIPLQEREEWLSRWAKDGDMPVMMVEFGTPLYTTFHRGRRGYNGATTSEPLYTEYCAIYQGADAYRLESPAYRETVASTFEKPMVWKRWHGVDFTRMHEGFNKLQELFQKNTWRSWRTWGITGGMIPWASGHGWLRGAEGDDPAILPNDPLPPFKAGLRGVWKANAPRHLTRYFRPEGMALTVAGKALVASNQETLAWIAGAPDFVDKTHHVRAGATLAKQAVLINDSRNSAKWSLIWRAVMGGEVIAEGTDHGVIGPASTIFVPMAVSVPSVLKGDRARGTISLACSIGDAKHADTFDFTAFASVPSETALPLTLLDPVGDTAALLRTLGISFSVWNGKPSRDLVVVGRNAFAKGGAAPSSLSDHLKAGGRVLMMAQDPAWLRDRLGLRVATRQLTRRAFPIIADHPALAGLDADAFRDWAGESRLLPPVDAPNEGIDMPIYGWRWGARHVVSSAPIEIPHRAGWRPILACEFDGAYTPLAEISLERGVLTICTLDLEDHAADPAAERVARAVFSAAASAIPEGRSPAVYFGGDAGTALLDASGIMWKRAGALPLDGLVVIGADSNVPDAKLEEFLRRGGRALILPRASAEAPLGVRLKHVDRHAGSINVPSWPACRGIWPGELRRRVDGSAWIVAGGADALGADGLLAEVRHGKGVAVFCQLNSASLDPDRLSYNRTTRWRWTRVLAQLASNLGASCVGDNHLSFPEADPESISLAGNWKALLTTPLAPTEINDPRPVDPGPSQGALDRIALNADLRGMQDVTVSKKWREYGGRWANAEGEAIFRRVIDIPAKWAGQDLTLSLGAVDDFDTTYFDGVIVGSTDKSVENSWATPRVYTVPGYLVKAGRHAISIRVFDHFGGGGLVGESRELKIFPKQRLTSTLEPLYHPDYMNDFSLGDDPYRYYRW